MKTVEQAIELTPLSLLERNKGKIIGFVPTMGALHEGHLTLLREARKNCDIVVCSIFVNPTQFNNPEDFEKYPVQIENDLELIKNIVDYVYLPKVEDVFPSTFIHEKYHFNGLEDILEGEKRPGHFNGVANVVNRLFEIVQADKAYFGEKDFQQLLIIKNMVKQKGLNIEIVPVPTVRNEKGLALSSRNQRLSEEGKEKALSVIKALNNVKSGSSTDEIAQKYLTPNNITLEYLSIVDEETFEIAKEFDPSKNQRAFIAAWLEGVRLIDNISLR